MPELRVKSSGKYLGQISEDELNFLIEQLEEESLTDEDYSIDRLSLEFMKGQGMSANLHKLMEEALGDGEEVEILYTR